MDDEYLEEEIQLDEGNDDDSFAPLIYACNKHFNSEFISIGSIIRLLVAERQKDPDFVQKCKGIFFEGMADAQIETRLDIMAELLMDDTDSDEATQTGALYGLFKKLFTEKEIETFFDYLYAPLTELIKTIETFSGSTDKSYKIFKTVDYLSVTAVLNTMSLVVSNILNGLNDKMILDIYQMCNSILSIDLGKKIIEAGVDISEEKETEALKIYDSFSRVYPFVFNILYYLYFAHVNCHFEFSDECHTMPLVNYNDAKLELFDRCITNAIENTDMLEMVTSDEILLTIIAYHILGSVSAEYCGNEELERMNRIRYMMIDSWNKSQEKGAAIIAGFMKLWREDGISLKVNKIRRAAGGEIRKAQLSGMSELLHYYLGLGNRISQGIVRHIDRFKVPIDSEDVSPILLCQMFEIAAISSKVVATLICNSQAAVDYLTTQASTVASVFLAKKAAGRVLLTVLTGKEEQMLALGEEYDQTEINSVVKEICNTPLDENNLRKLVNFQKLEYDPSMDGKDASSGTKVATTSKTA